MAAIEKKTRRYPTDLTDEEWSQVEPLLPKPGKTGRRRRIDLREVLNAIRYLARTGCGWRMLPVNFQAWQTVYWWVPAHRVRLFLFRTIHDLAVMIDRERAAGRGGDVGRKMAALMAKRDALKADLARLAESGETQVSRTDADARLLTKRGQTVAGYNVQIAVDDAHKLIVASEVVGDGNDTGQLHPMAVAAREALAVETLTVLADVGYFNRTMLKRCEDDGIIAYVPEAERTGRFAARRCFTHADFTYDAAANVYRCPGGAALQPTRTPKDKGGRIEVRYVSRKRTCDACSLRLRCIATKLALPPARRFAIFTCMDARLDPAKYAGLAEGDAHVIRNAGGRASDDAIRSLVISHKLLGTAVWFVVHHTDCGMQLFTDEVMGDLLADNLETATFDGATWSNPKHGGGSPAGRSVAWLTISDQDASVVDDVRRTRSHPLVPRHIPIFGFVYDVRSGRLVEVLEATRAGAAS